MQEGDQAAHALHRLSLGSDEAVGSGNQGRRGLQWRAGNPSLSVPWQSTAPARPRALPPRQTPSRAAFGGLQYHSNIHSSVFSGICSPLAPLFSGIVVKQIQAAQVCWLETWSLRPQQRLVEEFEHGHSGCRLHPAA